MIIEATPLDGVWIVDVEPLTDQRGYFARISSTEAFAPLVGSWLPTESSISYNSVAGTLRGMHWQADPHGEVKLVRCTRGAIFDVAVDIRPDSATFGKWASTELSGENRRSLLIGRGFAHGFISLTDDVEVLYQIDGGYCHQSSRTFCYADETVGIQWPLAPRVINKRDRAAPMLSGFVAPAVTLPS